MIFFPVIIASLLLVAAVTGLIVMTVNEANLNQVFIEGEESAAVGDFTAEEQGLMLYQRGTTSRLSSISQIWLLLPVLLFTLVFLVVLIGLVYLFTKLINVLPGAMLKVQEFMALMTYRVRHLLDKAIEPFLKYNSLKASVRQVRLAVRQQVSDLFGKVDRLE